MKSIMHTGYGIAAMVHLYTGIPYVMLNNTTLNKKLNILPNTAPPNNTFPQLKYFAVGNKGHTPTVKNGISKFTKVPHTPTDAAPFGLMPLVVREPTNDLSPTERARYILRRENTYNGKRFIEYYGRRIDYSKAKVKMEIVQLRPDGTEEFTPFIPDSSNLNPVPVNINPNGVNLIKAEHLKVTTAIDLVFNEKDCAELRNAANIAFGDEELAIVSEVALLSGVDYNVQVTNPGTAPFTFQESIATQVCQLNYTAHSAYTSDSGFKIALEIGDMVPMNGLIGVN